MIQLYGIKQCDTVRKACRWLDSKAVAYTFIDVRKQGIEPELLQQAADALGWERLINRRSATWRTLSDAEKSLSSATEAVALCQQYPTLMKRPLLHSEQGFLVGFTSSDYECLL